MLRALLCCARFTQEAAVVGGATPHSRGPQLMPRGIVMLRPELQRQIRSLNRLL